ncbi:uncharacterized protein [Blastocystis hominis]|uniref:Pentacotripeptide-repeat region of PRORP domain-containing protein n=1 Tax=Blastocystis hominis TaxID=12968 RepID=D8MA30_BLAHO|nr:uncharacterized protein [Blastocystis hominis]CBK24919.2 unnamed protein product [Blastocystis hominis]|eukprot:XP_012898967.1 uncharacterized protein [Blastocystis hominis]
MSRVQRFWETDPDAVMWKYGTELEKAKPDQAMMIWEEMTRNGVKQDKTAVNIYLKVLSKANDRKYLQEIERVKRLYNVN